MTETILDYLAENTKLSDLPNEEARWIAEELGMRAAIWMILTFGGIPVYLPKAAGTNLKHKYAIAHYDGKNARYLARKLGVAERTIYKWVKHKKSGAAPDKAAAPYSQLDLFTSRS